MISSAIYEGRLRHRRFEPHLHRFTYPLYLVYLDLGEVDALLGDSRWVSARRRALVRFRRADYGGDPALPLDEAIRQQVAARSGRRPEGPIRMLTNLRCFGTNFNPVSFYYCFDAADRHVEQLLVDINNTPWDERYAYVLTREGIDADAGRPGKLDFRLRKEFHVSPFFPMDQHYRWRFTEPGASLLVHMETFSGSGASSPVFDATLTLRRTAALTPSGLLRCQWRHPVMGLRVLYWIYAQAARLWLKKTPVHDHPGRLAAQATPQEEHHEPVDRPAG